MRRDAADGGGVRLEGLRRLLIRLETDLVALALACRDPRVPWTAKAVAALVVLYVFSPIDFVADFAMSGSIVVGVLDDLIVLPLGIVLAVRLVPPGLLAEHRERAAAGARAALPGSRLAVAALVAAWLGLVALGVYLASPSAPGGSA